MYAKTFLTFRSRPKVEVTLVDFRQVRVSYSGFHVQFLRYAIV
mgnify:CR=1 FL=1